MYWKKALVLGLIYAVFGLLLFAGAVPCLFASVTHMPCPGCGSSRAVWALLHGDLSTVLRMNPTGPVVALILGILGALSLHSMLTTGDLKRFADSRVTKISNRVIIGLAVISFVLWTARFFGYLGGPVPV